MLRRYIAVCFLGWILPLQADVYVETSTLMGMRTRCWTSGMKQRTETTGMPLAMSQSTIIRVDRGVQWIVNDKYKVYEEHPLAPDPETPPKPSPAVVENKEEAPATDAPPKVLFEKIDQERKIAGYPATGYRMLFNQKEEGVIWLTPMNDVLEKVEKETRAFERAQYKKLYENTGEGGEKALHQISDMLAGLMKGEVQGGIFTLAGLKPRDLPTGFPLAMEGSSEGTDWSLGMLGQKEEGREGDDKRVIVYEIQKISTDPTPDTLYEIPEGYQRVDSLQKYQQQELMEGFNPEQMQDLLKNVPEP